MKLPKQEEASGDGTPKDEDAGLFIFSDPADDRELWIS